MNNSLHLIVRPLTVICGLLATLLLVVPVRAQDAADDGLVAGLQTFTSAGKELSVLDGYKEAVLLKHKGWGCLTHMWFGGNWPGYEKTRIRVYVDGEKTPSIDMEMGMGHGYGFGDPVGPWGGERMGKTGSVSGVYDTMRIPFHTSIRVTAQRDRSSPDKAPFWWIISGTDHLRVTLAGVRLPERTHLKLYRVEGRLVKPLEKFDLCKVNGPGAVYEVAMAAKSAGPKKNFNYMEAMMRAYFGDAKEPVMLSSGLEDFFLGTYYFESGRYANDLAGLTYIDRKDCAFSAYRIFDRDPLFFQNGLRLACRCGEKVGNHTFGNPTDTIYTTYVWVYQW